MPDPKPTVAQRLKPSTSSVVSTALGAPLGVIAVWLIEEFMTMPLPTAVAAAIGSVVAIAAGYFFSGGRSDDTL